MNPNALLALAKEIFLQIDNVSPWRDLETLMIALHDRQVSEDEWEKSLTSAFVLRMGAFDTRLNQLRKLFSSAQHMTPFCDIARTLAQAFISSFHVFLAKVSVSRTEKPGFVKVRIASATDTLKNSPTYRDYRRKLGIAYVELVSWVQAEAEPARALR